MKKVLIFIALCGLSGLHGQSCINSNLTRQIIIDSFCTLTQTCFDLTNQINDIQTTLTSCCSTIQNDFDISFARLDDLEISLTECCADLETTITNLPTTISSDFSTVFTALEELNACGSLPITVSTTISIPGNYCLANDIVGTITINTSAVVLNLNGYEISGGTNGIVVQSNNKCIFVKNGFIKNTTSQGVLVQTGCSEVILQNLQIINLGASTYGISLNSCSNCLVSKCNIAQGYNGIMLDTTQNIVLEGCQVVNCSGTRGINSSNGSETSAFNCRVANFVAGGVIGFSLPSDSELINCTAQNFSASSSPAQGFLLADNSSAVNCTAQLIQSENLNYSRGFTVGNYCFLENCVAEQIISTGTTPRSTGYYLNSYSVLNNCKAIEINSPGIAIGFRIPASNNSLEGCVALNVGGNAVAADSIGFSDDGTGTRNMTNNCIALDCAGYGFSVLSTNNNIGTNNLAYNPGATNYQNMGATAAPGAAPIAGVNISA